MKKSTVPVRKTHPGFTALQTKGTPNGKKAAPIASTKGAPMAQGCAASGMISQ